MLELLHEAVPQATRVAILREGRYSATRRFDKGLDRAGHVLGLKLQRFEVKEPAQLPAMFDVMARERAGALLVEAVPFLHAHHRNVVDLAARHRLPSDLRI